MASYTVKMELSVEFVLDTGEHGAFEDDDLDPNDPKDVHKFLHDEWENIGLIDSYSGEWTLNALKVQKEG